MPTESALVILVPEAESVVGHFRDKYDPSAAAGMPAHITLLYPFKSPDRIDETTVTDLRRYFADTKPFQFSLNTVCHFSPRVLYLAPEPEEPFRLFTLAIWDRHNTPPYKGEHIDIVPHLSVAQVSNKRDLDHITDKFIQAAQAELPIRAKASEVALMDKRLGRWKLHTKFSLGV